MRSLTEPVPFGLYLHVPFCRKKCAYCDFYSAFASDGLLDRYAAKLQEEIREWGGKIDRPITSVYFGGGTPSLLAERLPTVMRAVRESFTLSKNAEITLEMNPEAQPQPVLEAAKVAGINRLSIGAQSGQDKRLSMLGRSHTAADTVRTVTLAREIGFSNLSVDCMIALPGSDLITLKDDLDFMLSLSPEHISGYLLKIEERTRFFQERGSLSLPDEEKAAEQYLSVCQTLALHGYGHYEISNYCRPGFESRHNLLYWQGNEYLGIGPSAHSFLNGKRFFYARDLQAFLRGDSPVSDGFGGGKEEFVMLRLRLSTGLSFSEYERRFGENPYGSLLAVCKPLAQENLLTLTPDHIALTEKGMLVSNSIIAGILTALEIKRRNV